MRVKRTAGISGAAVAALALGLVLVPATSASALTEKQCSNSPFSSLIGQTGSKNARTDEDGDCGTVYIRVQYNNPTGPPLWTSWRSGSQSAVQGSAGGANIKGEHKATHRTAFQTPVS